MQRGKASVQHYESGGRDMLRMLDGGTGRTIFTTTQTANGSEGKAEGEMAGHIVDQLRRAYDELLHEPVPDHLRELLEKLSDAEDQS
jgi:hypothetical protein